MKDLVTRRRFVREVLLASLLAQLPWAKLSMASEPLLKAKIPSTGDDLPRVGLGTYRGFDVNLAKDPARRQELHSVLKAFVELGGKLVDSSPMYGLAEEAVGTLSVELKAGPKLFVATKVWTRGKDAGIAQMTDSLKKLKRQNLELMQIHNLLDWQEHLATLRKWKEEGKIRYIGITHYTAGAFEELEKILKTEDGIDFLQIPYSLGERGAEKRLIPAAGDRGVAVIANEPFDGGALFGQVKGKKLPPWAAELGIESWSQYFLKFILASPGVQFVIPGTGKLKHLQDNMAAARGSVPTPKERERMRVYFDTV